MRVRVKTGKSGFIYGSLRTEGKEFTLKPVEHSIEKDAKGKLVIISVKDQFSDKWMERVTTKKKTIVESSDEDQPSSDSQGQ